MADIFVLIRHDETHTEIAVEREIEDPQEIYIFTFEQGRVIVCDCAEVFFDRARSLAGQYAKENALGGFIAWDYDEG